MARTKTVKTAKFTAEEIALQAKYPTHAFVPGTLSRPGEATVFGKKRVVTILCNKCGAERVLATSDLFHCLYCVTCTSLEKKVKKAIARAEKTESKKTDRRAK